jgi:hypothetical protein
MAMDHRPVSLYLPRALILIAEGAGRLPLRATGRLLIQPHTIGVHQRASRFICVKCFLLRCYRQQS